MMGPNFFKIQLYKANVDKRRELIKAMVMLTVGVASGTSLLNLWPTNGTANFKSRFILKPNSSELLNAVEQMSEDLCVNGICTDVDVYFSKALVNLRSEFFKSGRLLDTYKFRNNGEITFESTWKSYEDFRAFFDSPPMQGAFQAYQRQGFNIEFEIVS